MTMKTPNFEREAKEHAADNMDALDREISEMDFMFGAQFAWKQQQKRIEALEKAAMVYQGNWLDRGVEINKLLQKIEELTDELTECREY